MPFYLQKSETLPEGLRRIASEQIGKALDEVADDTMPLQEKVHSLRKRCKKMRGLLRLPQPLMCEAFEAEDQRFRQAGKLLAEYRDTQVFAKTIESLGGPPMEAETSATPVSMAALEQSGEILAGALVAVPDWPLDLHGFVDIGPGFARTYRKCVDAWTEILREPADENFHKLRKWTKYHWYHIRIIERINKPELRRRRTRVHKLQLLLGKAHDLYALQVAFATDPGFDAALLEKADALKHDLYEHAIRQGKKVFTVSVDELVARCAGWWVDWKR